MDDHLDGYYYTGQTPFRKPNESAFRFHARRLISIQTLGRLEYQVEEAETKFNRALGPVELTFVGLGAVIGTGVYVLMGTAAATQAGPSVTVSFMLGGFVSGIAALSYAEMASMIPIAGSAYTYAYASIGELAAWIIGWDLILEYMVGAATVSVGWSAYLVVFFQDAFNVDIPQKWIKAPIEWKDSAFHRTSNYFNTPAFIISLAVTTTIYFGIHMTARINNVFVAFKVLVLVIVIFSMIPFVKPENYHPYIATEFGVKGMLEGASTVFFAYIGFDSVSTTAQEARDPQVNLPIGIMSTIVIATIIYVGISVVTVGVAHYPLLNTDSPVVDAVKLTGMKWLVLLTELGALAATTSVILVLLISQPRVLYAMANDGLVPRFFANVHPIYKTPSTSTLISGILCAFCGGLLPIQVLSEISSVGTIFAYFVVNIGVIILRYTRKTVPRRFKVPGGPFLLPGLGAASSLLLLQGAKQDAIIRLLVWMAVGLLVYIFYGRRHSEINNPRLEEQSMRVIHENFSTNTLNYNGYLDDDLRQQYARQVARQMDYDQPRRRRSDYTVDERPSSEHGVRNLGHSYEMSGLPPNGSSPFDDGLSDGAVDSGHGVGAPTAPSEGHQEVIEDVINVPEHLSGHAESKDQSSSHSRSSSQPLQASPQTYPEMAHVS
ncbi:Cationic amino acid transporter-1 [Haplosporangium gracile]|nr:Cationic amino acid transporter-1 [Haplosporangium gracile]